MTERILVHIELGGSTVMAGTLFVQTGRSLTSTFTYDPAYAGRPDAYALDPGLPLHRAVGHTPGLPGALQDAAPDRWGRLLLGRHRQTAGQGAGRPYTDLDFLLGVSDESRQGALRFSRAPAGPYLAEHSVIPQMVSLPRLLRAAEAVDGGDDGIEATKLLLEAGSGSLGGARPKASVREGDTLHIAKFPHRADAWDVMAGEATLLELASRVGISTPKHRLTRIGDASVLVLQRFDREGRRRLGYLSALALIGGRDGEPHDYLEVAEALAAHGASPEADLKQLWRRLVFGTLVSNTDDHLRNVGLLRGRNGWRLAPAFDLNPDPGATHFQTSVLGDATRGGRMRALKQAIGEFRVTAAEGDRIVAEVTARVADWRVVGRSTGLAASDLDRLQPAFSSAADLG